MVAGVELVGHEDGQYLRPQGDVGVEGDAAAPAAQVVVERVPGLVRDELELGCLALRQAEELVGTPAQLRRQRLGSREERVGRQFALPAPGAVALAQGALPRDQLVEAPVRGGELVLGRGVQIDAVAAAHLLRVRHRAPVEPLGDCGETLQLSREPALALRLAEAAEGAGELPRLIGERSGRGWLLALHPLGELRRAVVEVDEAVDVAPEAQREEKVALDDGRTRPGFQQPLHELTPSLGPSAPERAGLTGGSPPDCGGRSGASGGSRPPVCSVAPVRILA